jgi:hypothetical protein
MQPKTEPTTAKISPFQRLAAQLEEMTDHELAKLARGLDTACNDLGPLSDT